MTTAPSRCFCFTYFVPDNTRDEAREICAGWDAQLNHGESHDINQLMVNMEEAPTTKKVHLQCAVWLGVSKRFTWVKNKLELPAVNYSIMRSEEASEKYHDKPETAFDHWEYVREGFAARGKTNKKAAAPKSDELFDYIQILAAENKWGWKNKAALAFPSLYARNSKQCEALYSALTQVPKEQAGVVLRTWQQQVVSVLSTPADGRTIHWVYDAVGNKGKSFLAKYLVTNHSAILLDGRVQDMAFAWEGQPVVVIDIARGQAENMDHLHVFAEKVASGHVFSSKYESKDKIFQPPHVIVFSNVRHNSSLWTAGRCMEIDLAGEVARDIALRFM